MPTPNILWGKWAHSNSTAQRFIISLKYNCLFHFLVNEHLHFLLVIIAFYFMSMPIFYGCPSWIYPGFADRVCGYRTSNLTTNQTVFKFAYSLSHFFKAACVVMWVFLAAISSFPGWRLHRYIFRPNGSRLAWNVNKQQEHTTLCVFHCFVYFWLKFFYTYTLPPLVTLPPQFVPLISDLLQPSCNHKMHY